MARKTSGSNLKWTKEEEALILSEIYQSKIYKIKRRTVESAKQIEKSARRIHDQLPGRTEDAIIQRARHILRNLYGETR